MGYVENDTALQMMQILRDDVNTASEEFEARDTPYRRRNLVRTFGAMVEGHTSGLLQTVREMVESPDWPSPFTNAELALIKGESYRLTGAGEATIGPARLPKVETFLFSLQMYAKWYGYPLSIPRQGKGWEAFSQTLKLRDRVTHPGAVPDLEVTLNEITIVAQAMEWWAQLYDRVHQDAPKYFRDSIRKAHQQLIGSRDALKKRRRVLDKAGGQPDA